MNTSAAPNPNQAHDRHRGETLYRFASFTVAQNQLEAMQATRHAFMGLADGIITTTKIGREQSLALTALEEAKYWTNQSIAKDGLRAHEPEPEATTATTATTDTADTADTLNILALPIEQDDVDNTPTLGAYLAELLVALLVEGEGFSSKRPLGNSDWEGYIDDALDSALHTHGVELNWGDLRIALTDALTGSNGGTK